MRKKVGASTIPHLDVHGGEPKSQGREILKTFSSPIIIPHLERSNWKFLSEQRARSGLTVRHMGGLRAAPIRFAPCNLSAT
jgi:hypothetical protein